MYRDRLKGWYTYVVARNFFLLLLNFSAWPCLGAAQQDLQRLFLSSVHLILQTKISPDTFPYPVSLCFWLLPRVLLASLFLVLVFSHLHAALKNRQDFQRALHSDGSTVPLLSIDPRNKIQKNIFLVLDIFSISEPR